VSEMSDGRRAFSGRPVETIDVATVRAGGLTTDDIRISVDGLAHQAEVARRNGDVQLAENLLRAAELTAFSEDELLQLYELLRPGRATPDELRGVAQRLTARGAPLAAALFTEAGTAYTRRGATSRAS
jgi:propanediol dehydratase small subunit